VRSAAGEAAALRQRLGDLHRARGGHEVLSLPEAGVGDPLVLLVVDRHALADVGIEPGGNAVVGDGELEFLGDRARHGHHRHLAFPGLAQPALVGELLHVTGALTVRVRPVQGCPREARKPEQYQHQQDICSLHHLLQPLRPRSFQLQPCLWLQLAYAEQHLFHSWIS